MSERVINTLERQLALHELKLHSLLSITTAINTQSSVEDLLGIYSFILKEQLNFRKFVLITNSNGWKIIHKSGIRGKIDLALHIDHLQRIKELTMVAESN